jgi:hypothetical protein
MPLLSRIARGGVPGDPTAPIRSPYGRGTWVSLLTARMLAERGHQVLVQ